MAMTITEKILARSAGRERVEPGEIIFARLDGLMGHDQKLSAFKLFERELKGQKVFDPQKVWIVFDHHAPADTIDAATQQKEMRRYIDKYGLETFFDIGAGGICHVVIPEQGLVKPGDVIAGGDSHTCTYGALGAFATGVGNTDFAYALDSGKLWLQVPATYRVVCSGKPGPYSGGKDIMLYLLGIIGTDGATYKALEFTGPTIEALPMADRFTICNMAVEAGAKNGIVPPDETTVAYLAARNAAGQDLAEKAAGLLSDAGAIFEKTIELDCKGLPPQVACPDLPDNVVPVDRIEKVRLNQVFIGSCTNGRIEDLRIAASLLKGGKVASGTRLIIIPGSQEVLRHAIEEGLWALFLSAGAMLCPPACGPCPGTDFGLLAAGETALATTNRNFSGRMGHASSKLYLSSPAVAAASALTGYITSPLEVMSK